jgi:hypothetical protein
MNDDEIIEEVKKWLRVKVQNDSRTRKMLLFLPGAILLMLLQTA